MTGEQRMVLKVIIDRSVREKLREQEHARLAAHNAYLREHGLMKPRKHVYTKAERAVRSRNARVQRRVAGRFV